MWHTRCAVQTWEPGASEGVTVAGGRGQGLAPNQVIWANDAFVNLAVDIYVVDQNNRRVVAYGPVCSSLSMSQLTTQQQQRGKKLKISPGVRAIGGTATRSVTKPTLPRTSSL